LVKIVASLETVPVRTSKSYKTKRPFPIPNPLKLKSAKASFVPSGDIFK